MLVRFIVSMLISSSVFAADYFEADTVYRTNEKGEKAFSMEFEKNSNRMVAKLGLEVTNYDAEILGHGYDLGRAESYRIAFPSEAIECELRSAGGEVYGEPQANLVNVILKYEGTACENMRDGFQVNMMTTVVFYNVPTLDGKGENIQVLRIRVYDAAP